MNSTILTFIENDEEDQQQNMTTEDPLYVNINAVEETPQTIIITSDNNEKIQHIPIQFFQEIWFDPLNVTNIQDVEENCENHIIAYKCDSHNESLETEETTHSCLICGSSNTTNTELSREKWIENENWRNDCAETICDLFFSSECHSFKEFFEIAYYCTSCQKLIWEADFTRRRIMSMQNTIDKLSLSLRKRFALNVSQLNISQRNNDDYPPSFKVFEFPGNLSFDEVVQQIYSENSSAFNFDMIETKWVPLQTKPKDRITDKYMMERKRKPKPGQAKRKKCGKTTHGTEAVVKECNLVINTRKPERPKDKIRKRKTKETELLINTSFENNTNHDSQDGHAGNIIEKPVIKNENQLLTAVAMDCYNLPEIEGKQARPRKQIFKIERDDNECLNNASTENCDFQTECSRSQSDNFEFEMQETSPELKPQLDLESDILNSKEKIIRQRKPPQRFITEDMSSKGLRRKKKVEKLKITIKSHSGNWKKQWLHKQNVKENHTWSRLKIRNKRIIAKSKPEINRQRCPVVGCNFKYVWKFTLRQHVKIVHKGIQVDEALFHCTVDGCGMKYSHQTSLTYHNKTVHEGIKVIYKCQLCSKKFPSISTLRRHKFTHPEMKIATDDPKYFKPTYDFTCSICDQGYLKEEDLVSHMEIHSGPNPFVCSHCNQQFTNRTTLTAHIRIEHDLETPTCEFCGKCFISGRSLQEHRKIHLNPNECFKCLECDYHTALKKSLKSHVEYRHTEAITVQCETCAKTFNNRLCLRQHMRIHNDQSRYKCRICEKSFKNWDTRKTHEELHSGLRMHFVCTFCGKEMNTGSALRSHERIHTRDPNIPLPKKPCNKRKSKSEKNLTTKEKQKNLQPKTPFNISHIVDCINNVACGSATENNESS